MKVVTVAAREVTLTEGIRIRRTTTYRMIITRYLFSIVDDLVSMMNSLIFHFIITSIKLAIVPPDFGGGA